RSDRNRPIRSLPGSPRPAPRLYVKEAALSGRLVACTLAVWLLLGSCAPPASRRATQSAGAADQAAAPSRPVEFVISTEPGGGSDIYARFIQGVIEKESLSPQPVLPVNKPGGAGAVAFQY